MKGPGCRRFGRLLSEIVDREATPREEAFLGRHRAACDACAREEEAASMSLNLLRCAAFGTEADAEPSFDRRVLRRAQVTMLRDGVRYWSPALLGGAVAAGLLLAAVQAMTKPVDPTGSHLGEARRVVKPSLAYNADDLPKTLR